MGGTVFIAAVEYVCEEGEGECVWGCDCVGVIAWVWKGVCG